MNFKNTNLGSTRGRLVDLQWKSASISTFPAALPDKVSLGGGEGRGEKETRPGKLDTERSFGGVHSWKGLREEEREKGGFSRPLLTSKCIRDSGGRCRMPDLPSTFILISLSLILIILSLFPSYLSLSNALIRFNCNYN